jgi:hypothetical protein
LIVGAVVDDESILALLAESACSTLSFASLLQAIMIKGSANTNDVLFIIILFLIKKAVSHKARIFVPVYKAYGNNLFLLIFK